MNPEFHYFDEDEINTESRLIKAFLPVMLIHRFTSAFQLRQLQYSMVLATCCCRTKKKRSASKRPIGNAHIRVCYVIPSPHMIMHVSLANIFSCSLFQLQSKKAFVRIPCKQILFAFSENISRTTRKAFAYYPCFRGWEPLL